jgi:aspartate aminotransferase
MGSSSPSVFSTAVVPAAPEDPLFGLVQTFRQDPSDQKVDLVIGAYRDNDAKPWILPVVKKVIHHPCNSILMKEAVTDGFYPG